MNHDDLDPSNHDTKDGATIKSARRVLEVLELFCPGH
jgi:hypothetical protein